MHNLSSELYRREAVEAYLQGGAENDDPATPRWTAARLVLPVSLLLALLTVATLITVPKWTIRIPIQSAAGNALSVRSGGILCADPPPVGSELEVVLQDGQRLRGSTTAVPRCGADRTELDVALPASGPVTGSDVVVSVGRVPLLRALMP